MSSPGCAVCGVINSKLLRCSQCKIVSYCSKNHQRDHWKAGHKIVCVKSKEVAAGISKTSRQGVGGSSEYRREGRPIKENPYTDEGSSENEILNSQIETLKSETAKIRAIEQKASQPEVVAGEEESKEGLGGFADICLEGAVECPAGGILEEVSRNVVRDMDEYGVCVVDHFLGSVMGRKVLDEVVGMYQSGTFKDGQTVSGTGGNVKSIRRDKIAWLDGSESHCKNISTLITKVDTVVRQANKMLNNGKMGTYVINGRTKAMAACYPAQGSHYVKHVDNPNKDGRCITAIYYLNTDWNVEKDGGLLRIFPEGADQVANIEPLFDRIIFFWSDRRNPHEVQPSYRTRYAITLWYFDANEREEATRKHMLQRQLKLQNSAAISS